MKNLYIRQEPFNDLSIIKNKEYIKIAYICSENKRTSWVPTIKRTIDSVRSIKERYITQYNEW